MIIKQLVHVNQLEKTEADYHYSSWDMEPHD